MFRSLFSRWRSAGKSAPPREGSGTYLIELLTKGPFALDERACRRIFASELGQLEMFENPGSYHYFLLEHRAAIPGGTVPAQLGRRRSIDAKDGLQNLSVPDQVEAVKPLRTLIGNEGSIDVGI